MKHGLCITLYQSQKIRTCTFKERSEFIAHNVALYGRGKKRVTFADRQEILYIFSERSYKKEMYVWRGNIIICIRFI